MSRGKKKEGKKMALSTKDIERIKKDLAKVDELKKALGMKAQVARWFVSQNRQFMSHKWVCGYYVRHKNSEYESTKMSGFGDW